MSARHTHARPPRIGATLVIIAVVFLACARKKSLPGADDGGGVQTIIVKVTRTPTPVPWTGRRTGVRDFRRLVAQLSFGLGVPLTNASLQGKFVDAFGAPLQISGTANHTYYEQTVDFVEHMNYQTTDQKRSAALEANRLRVVSSFCEVAVATAAGYPVTDARRGLFVNVALNQLLRADSDRFLRAAAVVFRRRGAITDEELGLIFTTMSSVSSTLGGAAGITGAWVSACIMIAGDSEAGEL